MGSSPSAWGSWELVVLVLVVYNVSNTYNDNDNNTSTSNSNHNNNNNNNVAVSVLCPRFVGLDADEGLRKLLEALKQTITIPKTPTAITSVSSLGGGIIA